MNKQDYIKLVTELCAAVGLASSHAVINTQHMVIRNRTVALIFDETIANDILFIYFDLGPLEAPNASELCRRMLISNLYAGRMAMGHFGMHPKSANAAYHARLPFTADLTGEEVAQFLNYHVTYLQNWDSNLLAASRTQKPGTPQTLHATAYRLSPRRRV